MYTTPRNTTLALDRYAHICYEGPICEQMDRFLQVMCGYEDDPYFGYVAPPPDVEECDHWTCLGLIHAACEACFVEAMELDAEQTFVSYPTVSQDPFFDAAPFPTGNRPDSPCGLCDSKCVRCDW